MVLWFSSAPSGKYLDGTTIKWIRLACLRVVLSSAQWRGVVNAVMNLRVAQMYWGRWKESSWEWGMTVLQDSSVHCCDPLQRPLAYVVAIEGFQRRSICSSRKRLVAVVDTEQKEIQLRNIGQSHLTASVTSCSSTRVWPQSASLNRFMFHLKTETESSLRNVVL
jgi:hypothetical protein